MLSRVVVRVNHCQWGMKYASTASVAMPTPYPDCTTVLAQRRHSGVTISVIIVNAAMKFPDTGTGTKRLRRRNATGNEMLPEAKRYRERERQGTECSRNDTHDGEWISKKIANAQPSAPMNDRA